MNDDPVRKKIMEKWIDPEVKSTLEWVRGAKLGEPWKPSTPRRRLNAIQKENQKWFRNLMLQTTYSLYAKPFKRLPRKSKKRIKVEFFKGVPILRGIRDL